jgi:hypothetical protein
MATSGQVDTFWRPGARAVGWIRRSLPDGTFAALEILTPVSVGIAGVLTKVYSNECWPIKALIVSIIVQALMTYLSKSGGKLDESVAESEVQRARDETQRVKSEASAELQRRKMDFAGNLSQLLKAAVAKDQVQIDVIQMGLLRHAVDLIRRELELPDTDTRIAACWLARVNGKDKFKTMIYDRHRTDRSPGTVRPIQEGLPGASQAFLTGSVCCITDTHDKRVRNYFQPPPIYRTILSVPAAVLNIPEGSGSIPVRTEGVLNVDCTETGILKESHAFLVHDIAFLMALCVRVTGGTK